MRYAGRILLGLCFALLLLLGARTLVEGPADTEIAPPLPVCLPDGSLVALEADAAQQGVLTEDCRQAVRQRAARQDKQPRAPAILPVRDRNGRPMASRTYARTAYTVCPLEDMPG